MTSPSSPQVSYPQVEHLSTMPTAQEIAERYIMAVPWWNVHHAGQRTSPMVEAGIAAVSLDPFIPEGPKGPLPGRHYYWDRRSKRVVYGRYGLLALLEQISFEMLPALCKCQRSYHDTQLVGLNYFVAGRYLTPTGIWSQITASKEWVREAELSGLTPAAVNEELKHAAAKAESKAWNRIYRQILSGLPRDESLNDFDFRSRPHLVPFVRWAPDFANPMVQQMIGAAGAGAMQLLYGGAPVVAPTAAPGWTPATSAGNSDAPTPPATRNDVPPPDDDPPYDEPAPDSTPVDPPQQTAAKPDDVTAASRWDAHAFKRLDIPTRATVLGVLATAAGLDPPAPIFKHYGVTAFRELTEPQQFDCWKRLHAAHQRQQGAAA